MTQALRRPPVLAGVALTAFLTWGLVGPLASVRLIVLALAIGVAAISAAAYLVWSVHPAYTLCGALALSVCAGNWPLLGLPGALAPDRILFVLGVGAVLLKAPPIRDRPPLRWGAAAWAMAAVLLWALGSAQVSGAIFDRGEMFEILERLGIVPFALFLVAPAAFAAEYHRRVLLGTLVGLGAYLGFTAAMESANAEALVFPRFINDPAVGIHADRARGPFLEAVTNGAGLYAGAIGAAIGLTVWRERWQRAGLLATLALCAAGVLFTETRSVWLGATIATVGTLLLVREIRRWLIPGIVAAVAILALSFALLPGLQEAVTARKNQQGTVYDRKNLSRAAINIVEAKPLIGIGWGRFTRDSADYFEQSPDFPLTASQQVIHNVFLTYAVEMGLIGLVLWVLTVLVGIGSALMLRVGPQLAPWQIGLAAYTIFFLVISNFVFAQVFPNDMLWLLAGVVMAGGIRSSERAPVSTRELVPAGAP